MTRNGSNPGSVLEQTDAEPFTSLEPRADGFRNDLEPGSELSPETSWTPGTRP